MNEELKQKITEMEQSIAAMQLDLAASKKKLSLIPHFSDAITDIVVTGMGYSRFGNRVVLSGEESDTEIIQGGCALKGGYAETDSTIGANVDITWSSSIERSAIATVGGIAGTITIAKDGLYLCLVYGNVEHNFTMNGFDAPKMARIVLRKNGEDQSAAGGAAKMQSTQVGVLESWISGVDLLELNVGDVITARFNGRKAVYPSATTPSVSNAQLSVIYHGA